MVTTWSFPYFNPNSLQRVPVSYLVCCYTCRWQMLLTLKPYRVMEVWHVKIVPNASCFRSRFKTICNCLVYVHIWINASLCMFCGCHFWIIIIKGNENWLLVLKKSATRIFLTPGSNGKTILDTREENFGSSWLTQFMCFASAVKTWTVSLEMQLANETRKTYKILAGKPL